MFLFLLLALLLETLNSCLISASSYLASRSPSSVYSSIFKLDANYYVVFYIAGSPYSIRGVIFDDSGLALCGEFTASSGTTTTESAGSPLNGKFVSVFADPSFNIYYKFIQSDCTVGATVKVNTVSTGSYARVATLTNGNFVVVYCNQANTAIMIRIFDPSGVNVKSETGITTGLVYQDFSVASLRGGGFAIAYAENTYTTRILYCDNAGTVTVNSFQANTVNTATNSFSVAALSNGDLLFAYKDTGTNIFAKTYKPDGTARVNQYTVSAATLSFPVISAADDGGYAIAYQTASGIQYKFYDNYGTQLGFEFTAVNPGSIYNKNVATFTGSGKFVINYPTAGDINNAQSTFTTCASYDPNTITTPSTPSTPGTNSTNTTNITNTTNTTNNSQNSNSTNNTNQTTGSNNTNFPNTSNITNSRNSTNINNSNTTNGSSPSNNTNSSTPNTSNGSNSTNSSNSSTNNPTNSSLGSVSDFSMELSNKAKLGMGVALGVTLGTEFIKNTNPTLLWAVMSLLQRFFYLLFLNLDLPENLQNFLLIFSFANLDFLPNLAIEIFSFPDLESPQKFFENKFYGHFIKTMAPNLQIWVVLFIIHTYLRYTRKRTYLTQKAKSMVQESFPIRTYIQSAMYLMIAGILQIYNLHFNEPNLIASSALGLIFVIFIGITPFLFFYVIFKEKRSSVVWRVLFEDFDSEKREKKYFPVYEFVLSILYSLDIALFYYQPLYQMIFLIIPNFIYCIMLLVAKPRKKKRENLHYTILEILCLIIHSLLAGYLNEIEYQQAELLGTIIIFVIIFTVIFALLPAFYENYILLKSLIQRICFKQKNGAKYKKPLKIKLVNPKLDTDVEMIPKITKLNSDSDELCSQKDGNNDSKKFSSIQKNNTKASTMDSMSKDEQFIPRKKPELFDMSHIPSSRMVAKIEDLEPPSKLRFRKNSDSSETELNLVSLNDLSKMGIFDLVESKKLSFQENKPSKRNILSNLNRKIKEGSLDDTLEY